MDERSDGQRHWSTSGLAMAIAFRYMEVVAFVDIPLLAGSQKSIESSGGLLVERVGEQALEG